MKGITIRFKKLFRKVREGETVDAIISYRKGIFTRYEDCDEWEHILYIDLYLVRLRFDWKTITKYNKNDSHSDEFHSFTRF